MTREQMIYECRKKLPYPISFYDKLNDGSVYWVWNRHVVQGIPINKKQQKYKAANDIARSIEVPTESYKQMSISDLPVQQSNSDESISMEEYARRCLNRGEINSLTSHVYGESVCKVIVENGLTVEEYMEIMYPEQEPSIFYNEVDGCYYRKTDGAGFNLVSDEELSDLDISNEKIGLIEVDSQPSQIDPPKSLIRKPKPGI